MNTRYRFTTIDALIIGGLLILLFIVLSLTGGDLHDYPCGTHLPNGYFRECK